jgi:hypothetical protein
VDRVLVVIGARRAHNENMRRLMRRVIAYGGSMLVGGLLFLQSSGGPTTAAIVPRLNAESMRPVPSVPLRTPPANGMVWVPDRYIAVPDQPHAAMVPGHWEQPVAPNQVYVPPVVVIEPPDSKATVVPPGVRDPVANRVGP